jgi:uncharacterized membrane protein (UPF0127 family)
LKICFRGKEIEVPVREVQGFGSVRGLMFRSLSRAGPLAFRFGRPARMAIHSLFVRFWFVAIWLDSEGRVMEWRLVRPWLLTVKPRKKYWTLVEVPLSKKYAFVVDFLRQRGSSDPRAHADRSRV